MLFRCCSDAEKSVYRNPGDIIYMVMGSIISSATERLLLLLGWDRVESHRARLYSKKKTVKAAIRRRKRSSGEPDKPGEPGAEMFAAPALGPVRIVSQIARTSGTSNWTADAFDTAATGTV